MYRHYGWGGLRDSGSMGRGICKYRQYGMVEALQAQIQSIEFSSAVESHLSGFYT